MTGTQTRRCHAHKAENFLAFVELAGVVIRMGVLEMRSSPALRVVSRGTSDGVVGGGWRWPSTCSSVVRTKNDQEFFMKKTSKKLSLKVQTVRVLTDTDLDRAAGGGFVTTYVTCMQKPTTTAPQCTLKPGTTAIICN
jgi:hypothetical protein